MDEKVIHDQASVLDQDEASPPSPSYAPEVNDKEETRHKSSEAAESPQLGALVQYWVDRALQFFSHASNETLGACFVGLGASTYLILGRVGLVLIGVVGGITLHATWEHSSAVPGSDGDSTDKDATKRKELGLEVVKRVWKWRDNRRNEELGEDDDVLDDVKLKLYKGKTLDYSEFQAETAAALDTFTNAVIRDYVKWWYSPVLPGEEDFPVACRQTLTAFILSLSSHVSRKRPEEMFLNFSINSSSIMIALFAELAAALSASPNSDAATAIQTYIELKPESGLAQMLDQKAQARKLSLVSEDILQNYLDPKAYNFPPVRVFLHKVMSQLVLGMTLESCSKPDWINGWIEYLLEEEEKSSVLQVIDASAEGAMGDHEMNKTGLAASNDDQEPAKLNERRRQVSRAESAMEEALHEAKRLTEMIAEDEAKKSQAQSETLVSSDISEDTTQGTMTPTSSQSESGRDESSGVMADAVPDEPIETVEAMAPGAHQNPHIITFDQILPAEMLGSMAEDIKPVLTLHNAKISIFDDSVSGEKTVMKSKPNVDYLIQVEPADSRFSGWMIARKYMDFEVLHEVLRRISVITGVGFTDAHADLPNWKKLTKQAFRDDLETYLIDAMKYQQLAESEGMKRFLDKEQGLSKSPSAKKGLAWPDPLSMGKGMMDVLVKAPKEVAGGGKAIFGGVTSVLGGVKKAATPYPQPKRTTSSSSIPFRASVSTLDRQSSDLAQRQAGDSHDHGSRASLESSHSRPQSIKNYKTRPSTSSQISVTSQPPADVNSSSSSTDTGAQTAASSDLDTLNLPPPPSAIDDLDQPLSASTPTSPTKNSAGHADAQPPTPTSTAMLRKSGPQSAPLTEQETTVTLDLLFAVISELYTLSSAWTFRRTLLQAARTFLLRPGNPQLESIRVLIQESVIDAHGSDEGIARLILKTRENSLPTEEELAAWPPALSEKESDQLRVRARKALVERGMPQALTSVMGAAASGEALGKVFDCLQIRDVAKSLQFGLMLQALRTIVQ